MVKFVVSFFCVCTYLHDLHLSLAQFIAMLQFFRLSTSGLLMGYARDGYVEGDVDVCRILC